MRLLQWNIQWCRGIDGRVDAARIARVATAIADPDIACLQEVAVNFSPLAGSSGEDQVALLRELFPGYHVFFACGVDVPGDAGERRQFGNVILTRLPVRQVFRHSMPWPPEDDTPSMPRVALEAVIDAPWGPLRVTTTHLEFYSGAQRAAQVRRLIEIDAEARAHACARPSPRYASGPFQPLARPRSGILSGDFNMRPDDALMGELGRAYADAWRLRHPGEPHPPTFCLHGDEHGKDPYCCDFVFVTPDLAPRVSQVRIDLDTQASDHQPVIVEFT